MIVPPKLPACDGDQEESPWKRKQQQYGKEEEKWTVVPIGRRDESLDVVIKEKISRNARPFRIVQNRYHGAAIAIVIHSPAG